MADKECLDSAQSCVSWQSCTADLDKELDAYLETEWEGVVADLASLVRIPSIEDLAAARPGAPFGPKTREALDQVLAIAARMGLSVHDCEGYLGYGDLPGVRDAQIGIIAHVDVVPAGPGWTVEPFDVTRRDGYLLGRGVVDDKGPLVIALHALHFWQRKLAREGGRFPYTVRFLFGANEETNMKDVAYYQAHYENPAFLFTPDAEFPVCYGEAGICSGTLVSDAFEGGEICAFEGGVAVNAVAGEAFAVVRSQVESLPTAERISLTSAGEGLVHIEAHGKSAHASTPEQGINALGLLADYLLNAGIGTPQERAFLELLQRLLAHTDGSGLGIACSDEHFGALTAVGGKAWIEDGRIHQTIDVRYPTSITSAEIAQKVAAIAARAGASFTLAHDKTPFLLGADSPAVQALLAAYNEVTGENAQAFTMKGGTYARMFPVAASFGPEKPWEKDPDWVGSMHGPDEGVSEELLKQAFRIYAATLPKLMSLDL